MKSTLKARINNKHAPVLPIPLLDLLKLAPVVLLREHICPLKPILNISNKKTKLDIVIVPEIKKIVPPLNMAIREIKQPLPPNTKLPEIIIPKITK
ncbi:MAG: hypothetical protein IM638_10765 [Bacteroidetes bacterium]|nr:hypothetical protein [Bacteroidota bacterium]